MPLKSGLSQTRIRIEKRHAIDPTEKYICCLNYNLAWLQDEIDRVVRLWQYGTPMWEIVRITGRYEIEITILLLDLAEQGKIEARNGGVFGVFFGGAERRA